MVGLFSKFYDAKMITTTVLVVISLGRVWFSMFKI